MSCNKRLSTEEIKRFSLDWNKDVYLDDCWQIKSFSSCYSWEIIRF